MEINKKNVIDIKNLINLTPPEYRHKINLLFNKDIPREPNTSDELMIHRLAKLKETDMQQHFHREFNSMASDINISNEFSRGEFVQNDNGDTAGGKLTQIQRIVLYKRKKAEGSKKGFPDVSMYIYNHRMSLRDTVFCEVKRITTPSGINLTEEQFKWFLKLNDMGFDAYITNNPVFFRDVILGSINKFLLI